MQRSQREPIEEKEQLVMLQGERRKEPTVIGDDNASKISGKDGGGGVEWAKLTRE